MSKIERENLLRQTGLVGPWRPAFAMCSLVAFTTLGFIYWNESKPGDKFCMAPKLINDRTYPWVLLCVGGTVGNFSLQVVRLISKLEADTHSSATLMVLLITGIQAFAQVCMIADVAKFSVCEDLFGIRTSVFLWVEWLSTVPIMFYLTSIMDVNKLKLNWDDKVVIFFSIAGLFCLCMINFTHNHTIATTLMIIANTIMTYALFYLHGGSYYAHAEAVRKARETADIGPATSLFINVKKRKLLCGAFMNYFFSLFPFFYFLKYVEVLDHDGMFIAFCALNFLSKGIFGAIVTDSHTELLDPKTFLLFSERHRAAEARKSFMKYMFEEVRVPLMSINLGISLLQESEHIEGADRETVTMVKEAGKFMIETLTDVLSLQKIEDGKLVLDMKPFHITDLIYYVKESYQSLCEKKSLNVAYGVAGDVPSVVKGDLKMLQQVLGTFLNNAIKSSDQQGGVVVSVTYGTRTPNCVTFAVRDFGPMIPVEVQKDLFKNISQIKFEEWAQSDRESRFGYGLGLAICKEIVQLHGGEIGCECTPRSNTDPSVGGNEFFVTIDFEVCDEEDAAPPDTEL